MRKIILSTQVTLNGFNDHTDAIVNEESWKYVNDLCTTIDTVIFGRVTYQLFESYWPSVVNNPSGTRNEQEFSRWINRTDKIVFSRTLKKTGWENSRVIQNNISKEIAQMKESLVKIW